MTAKTKTWQKNVQPLPILNPKKNEILKSSFEVIVPQEKTTYKFFGSFSFDKDAEDCMGTGTLTMPYEPALWSFWEPGFQELTIKAGTFDHSVIFHGRTRSIKQDGHIIEIALQDDGWRLKQQYDGEVPSGSVAGAFTMLVSKAGMTPLICGLKEDYQIQTEETTEGNISGSATGGVVGTYPVEGSNLSSDESSTESSDEPVSATKPTVNPASSTNMADLIMKSAAKFDYCGGCTTASCMDDKGCGDCHAMSDWLYGKFTNIGLACRIIEYNSGYSSNHQTVQLKNSSGEWYDPIYTNNGIKNDFNVYPPNHSIDRVIKTNNATGVDKEGSFNVGGSGDQEKTYEEMLDDIIQTNDLIYYTDFNNQCILYDYPSLMEEIESKCFNIENWMIKYPSFNLDLNQFGFYNTVEIKYKNGKIKESYEDLVKVFGEVVKKMDEPKMNKIEARIAAKSRLATLLRDFAMEIQLETLHSGAILPGTFVKAPNPATRNTEIYYVSGINVSQEPNSPLMVSLSLLYAPKNPEVSSIPEIAGTTGTLVSGPADPSSITNLAKSLGSPAACRQWLTSNMTYESYNNSIQSTATTLKRRRGNCVDGNNLLAEMCRVLGFQASSPHCGYGCQPWSSSHCVAFITIGGQQKIGDWLPDCKLNQI